MSNAPVHFKDHEQLLQLVGNVVDNSELIDMAILITIGRDGRPMVGGNLDSPEQIVEVMRRLVGAADEIATVSRIDIPKGN